jgi:hypothetical protein
MCMYIYKYVYINIYVIYRDAVNAINDRLNDSLENMKKLHENEKENFELQLSILKNDNDELSIENTALANVLLKNSKTSIGNFNSSIDNSNNSLLSLIQSKNESSQNNDHENERTFYEGTPRTFFENTPSIIRYPIDIKTPVVPYPLTRYLRTYVHVNVYIIYMYVYIFFIYVILMHLFIHLLILRFIYSKMVIYKCIYTYTKMYIYREKRGSMAPSVAPIYIQRKEVVSCYYSCYLFMNIYIYTYICIYINIYKHNLIYIQRKEGVSCYYGTSGAADDD